ncbi:Beta-defensin 123 [Manis javanica]|nr:Beta-defensin 123 [Manis javanica]
MVWLSEKLWMSWLALGHAFWAPGCGPASEIQEPALLDPSSELSDWTPLNTGAKIIKADIGFTRQDAIEEHVCGGSSTLRRLKTERPEATPWLSEIMKLLLLTLAVLVLLSQVIPGRTEKCWNLHGSCREKCIKNEKVYIFCRSGKLCCLKPKYQPRI